MFKLTARGLWAHKLRFALTGLAVVLGVAFMAGTMVLTDTMDRTFDGLFESTNAGIDVVVQRPVTIDSDIGDVRERIDGRHARPVQDRRRRRRRRRIAPGLRPAGQGRRRGPRHRGPPPTIGTNWVDRGAQPVLDRRATRRRRPTRSSSTRAPPIVRAGRWATPSRCSPRGSPGSSPSSARPPSARSRAPRLLARRRRRRRRPRSCSAKPGTTTPSSWPPTAAAPPPSWPTPRHQLDDAPGPASTCSPARPTRPRSRASSRRTCSFFNQFLLAFAYVSLFVGMFIIYNTFSIVVAQRKKDMAMLRAIGASRRQLLTLGARRVPRRGPGRIGGRSRRWCGDVDGSAGAARGGRPGDPLRRPGHLDRTDRHRGFVVGITVTVLSAIAPALRASRVAAHRGAPGGQHRSHGVVHRAGPSSASSSPAPGSRPSPPAWSPRVAGALQLIGLGAVGTILGVFVLGPVIARSGGRCPRLAAPPPVRHDGSHRPGERDAQPEADLGHRLGPDDRRRPGRVHHDPGCVDARSRWRRSVDRSHASRLRGRLRRLG